MKFDEWRENDPTVSKGEDNAGVSYPAPSQARNLGFAWPDGRKMFLNYSYLVAGECAAGNGEMVLTFTTHFATIQGFRLDILFAELMEHRPKMITCIEERYNNLQEEGHPVINEIVVIQKN